MKFMVLWKIHEDKWLPILGMWAGLSAEERADAGPGVTILGRWHDSAARRGVAIIETSDLAAFHTYLGRWNPYMDLDVSPVTDDEESAAVARAVVAQASG